MCANSFEIRDSRVDCFVCNLRGNFRGVSSDEDEEEEEEEGGEIRDPEARKIIKIVAGAGVRLFPFPGKCPEVKKC